ncbi:putative extracellular deoxyribonuclease [Bifidobacterium actinocoloniiforme DSM 22766]|uniref:Putative extracellular deoxyribonuclease n=1 Tax=Bifidobacterium actinocoloniiforme DSM 22766 TaxID=1437605 RepID=A0A086Z222_9BIFI|nr:HNH endonuclease family protein [Bifidobacterium actinocoloniiforme]AKV55998.1 deoxyribonuclease [Bifidobacterium actinocoloniiforme DSM 22766]KFI40572.1 putative extracellular deoxyribonuclease [Bifidobacterium actinocoloniiforme DSM 22766]
MGAYRPSGGSRRGRRSPGSARFRSSSLGERLLIALVVAVVIGVTIGLLLPRLSPQVSRMTGGYTASGDAANTLGTLSVVDRPKPHHHYNRDSFGFKMTDEDGNGCNIREDVLTRDLKDVRTTTPGGCKVASGILHDPYTGKTIAFTRGARTSAQVQIDHVVALEDAWQSGASEWDQARRYQLGNDPYNLLAVDGPSNQEKGSASAAYWLPPQASYRCDYVARQIGVKSKYELSVTSQEKDAMMMVLHSCPGQPVPSK